jgi:hypothetical protein
MMLLNGKHNIEVIGEAADGVELWREPMLGYWFKKAIASLSLLHFIEFTMLSRMIGQVAYTRLRNDGVVVKTNDDPIRINDMIILKNADADIAIHCFLKVLIC